ncbi:MAG: transcription-repair coupling factor [Terriglobia bacterium]
MSSRDWTEKLIRATGIDQILRQLESGASRFVLTGITPSAKPAVLAGLHHQLKKPILYIGRDSSNLDSLRNAAAFYLDVFSNRNGARLSVFPALEPDAYSGLSPHAEVLEERALSLWRVFESTVDILLCPLTAVLSRVPNLREIFTAVPRLKVGTEYSLQTITNYLLAAGYVHEEPVNSHGSYSVRGGILDVFPPDSENPCRIEFFGDEVESLREFSVKSQRSIGPVQEVLCVPMREILLDPSALKEWGEQAKLRLGNETSQDFLDHQVTCALNGEFFQGVEYALPMTQTLPHTVFDFIPEFFLVIDEPLDLQSDYQHWYEKCLKEQAALRSRGIPSAAIEELFISFEELSGLTSRHSSVLLDQLGTFQEDSLFQKEPRSTRRDHDALHPRKSEGLPQHENELATDVLRRERPHEVSPDSESADDSSPFQEGKDTVRIVCDIRPSRKYHGNLRELVRDIERGAQQGTVQVLVQGTLGKAERVYEILKEYDLDVSPAFQSQKEGTSPGLSEVQLATFVVCGEVYEGFEVRLEGILILGETDVFDEVELLDRPVRSKQKSTTFISDLRELKPGDHVVHIDHGIGRFLGVKQMFAEGAGREFMVITYLGDDKIYVPLERLDLVQKYSSAEGARPQLDKLGGTTWVKTKSRVKKSLRDMADDLLKLYAGRKISPGYAFSPQGHWHKEFEDVFEFVETPDQASAIQDVYKDMESEVPMDRLLCGDVGFGKTEVAMRAAFKAVFDGKQVAVLAPTTVLSYQHYLRFKQRFNAFPMNIEMLSRFRTPKDQVEITKKIDAGQVDIIIGTHRLLSKDVQYRDLGLLIVDEEQQFGVSHKEKLKQLKINVDTLTMTATPIPRTLHMSLMGMRDMSVIETAPRDRLSIQTFVVPFNKQVIQAAIEQELSRGGQVYFVHNKVLSIYSVASMISKLCPKARILVGHGQMGEKELEATMLKFVRHEADVLVSTTIIENGLDIPLVNTLIVNRADRFGLAQLYQLRGRVGRSNRRAYAYLLTPPDKALTGVARQRLAALKEFSELGSGFKVAALDLELRGAGNLLGGEQHGHINALGFDFYCQILERTIEELQGNEVVPEIQTQINLKIPVKIPTDYIADERQRLSIYKRISSLKHEREMDELLIELEDRYGGVPKEVVNLIDFVRLRLVAQRALVQSIERERDTISIKFHEKTPVQAQRVVEFVSSHPETSVMPSGALRVQTAGLLNSEIIPSIRAILLELLP